MIPFALRNITEYLQKLSQLYEEQQRQEDFGLSGFTLFELPIVKWKGYEEPRDLDELDFIVSHVTAVTGGFGVSKRRVRYWTKKITEHLRAGDSRSPTRMPVIDMELCESGAWYAQFNDSVFLEVMAEQLARRIALWERYRGYTPYHQIGAANGDNCANRELEHVTWHGTSGNFGVGWALDVGGTQELEQWHIDTGCASLYTLCSRILEVSARARKKGIRIAPHGCFSNRRFQDTGPETHQKVVKEACRQIDCLDIDYHMHKGTGRPIPTLFDPEAYYNAKGKRIKL